MLARLSDALSHNLTLADGAGDVLTAYLSNARSESLADAFLETPLFSTSFAGGSGTHAEMLPDAVIARGSIG
jgi:hypothetical protein